MDTRTRTTPSRPPLPHPPPPLPHLFLPLLLLLLLLGFGSLPACEAVVPQIPWEKVEGFWRTLYVAATNASLVEEGGPLRTYLRKVRCRDDRCRVLIAVFYLKWRGRCHRVRFVLKKGRNNEVYVGRYQGNVYPMIDYVDRGFLLVHYYYLDSRRATTRVAMGGAQDKLPRTLMKTFEDVLDQNGIEDENMRPTADTDTCPSR